MANIGTPPPPQNQDIGAPLMGLYLDRPAHKVDPRGFSACNNVRIEQGRVHSDLMGWALNAFDQLPGPCVYLSEFVNSFGARQLIAATTTDLILLAAGANQNSYITPVVNLGTVTVTNGSPTVTGTGTRWATDIQFGDHATVQTTATAGATTIFLTAPLTGVPLGLPVTDLNNAGAIQPGTFLAGYSIPAAFIVLSQPLIGTVTANDVLQVGNGISLRPNLRPGDQIFFGGNNQSAINVTWYTVQSVQSDTQLTLTANYAGATGTALYTGRQCLTNTVNSPLPRLPACFSSNYAAAGGYNNTNSTSTSTTGGDAWFFTNGIDPVVVFNSAYPFSALYARSIPFVCACLHQSRGLMIYGGLTQAGASFSLSGSIASSDNGFPLQLAGGVSFQGIATDGPFQITRIASLGSSVMLYASGTMSGSPDNQDDLGGAVISASFVGFPTIWAFSDVIKTRGPLNGGCVAEFPDRHQFLATDGEYRYNGLFIQVMNDQVWRQVLKSYDTTRPGAAFNIQYTPRGDLIWVVPLSTDPVGQLFANTAYVEHYMEQANSYLFKPMTQRDFPFTCACVVQNPPAQITFAFFGTSTIPNFNQNVQAWNVGNFVGNQPALITGDLQGRVWLLYSSNTQAGSPALATCTWGARIIGNARARSLVTRVYPEIDFIASPASSVTVTLTLQDAIAGPVTITDVQSFNPNYAGNRFTTHYRRGRVMAVTISDTAGLGWISDGYDYDTAFGGPLR